MADQENQQAETKPGKQEWQTPILIVLDRGPAAGQFTQPNEAPKQNPDPMESGEPGIGIGRGPNTFGPS